MHKFLSNNSPSFKTLRTIVQGLVGVIIANLDTLIAQAEVLPMWARPIIAAAVMAILSPIMATLGGEELPADYFESEGADE